MAENNDFLSLFKDLCGTFLDAREVHLRRHVDRILSRSHKRKRLQNSAYNSLFRNLIGPHYSSNGVYDSAKCSTSTQLESHGHVFSLRCQGRYDEANELENCLNRYYNIMKEEEGKDNIVKFLLLLTDTGEASSPALLGKNVFKTPLMDQTREPSASGVIPRGPRVYGDSKIPRNITEDRMYMHFPDDVFQRIGVGECVEPRIDSSMLHCNVFTQQPGVGLPFIFNTETGPTQYERRNESSLFGALVHSHTSSLDVKLEIPDLPDRVDKIGFQVPKCFEMEAYRDEGYASTVASTPTSDLTNSQIDSGLGGRLSPDIWDTACDPRADHPQKLLTWETVGRHGFVKQRPFVTDAGPQTFDRLYKVRMELLQMLDPTLDLPELQQITMKKLVKDVLYLLIGVPSTTFVYDASNQRFCVRDGVCVTGLSPESLKQACSPLLQGGTHYLRLEHFTRPVNMSDINCMGVVFQAFTQGIHRYLQHYRGCILSLSRGGGADTHTLLSLTFTLSTVLSQVCFLAELCGCSVSGRVVPGALADSRFPTGVALLSYLYEECVDAANCHHYPVLLSLLHCATRPYLLFIQDWVYHGIHRDTYSEFMIRVNDEYLQCRSERYWTRGFHLMQGDAPEEMCVPLFLKDLANDIFVCGKSINLLRLVSPRHFLFKVGDNEVPSVGITFSEEDLNMIENRCLVYRSRMKMIGAQLTITRRQILAAKQQAKQDLLIVGRQTAARQMQKYKERSIERKIAQDKKKRKLFSELKSQMETDLDRRAGERQTERAEGAAQVAGLSRQEVVESRVSEELERQTREEIIEYYSKLSAEAVLREQRALWHVRREKLRDKRINFMEKLDLELARELEERPMVVGGDSVFNDEMDHGAAGEFARDTVDLPAWARVGMEAEETVQVTGGDGERRIWPGAAAVPGAEGNTMSLSAADNLPKWAADKIAGDNTQTEVVTGDTPVTKSHPSQSSIQGVLYQSEETASKQPYVKYATDRQHPSDLSNQGLLKIDEIEVTLDAKSKTDYATVEDLKARERLHEEHTGQSLAREGAARHAASSVIQDLMYGQEGGMGDKEDSEGVDKGKEVSTADPELEAEVKKQLEIRKKSPMKSPSVRSQAKTHIRLSSGVNASTESRGQADYKPAIGTVSVSRITEETLGASSVPHIKAVSGRSIGEQSAEAGGDRAQVRSVAGVGATVESQEETGEKQHLKKVAGKSASAETVESAETKTGVKFNPDVHANLESIEVATAVKKRSVFGHMTDMSLEEFKALRAPKLRKNTQNYAAKESDWFSYTVKRVCRKKVQGRDIGERSDEVDSSQKPLIRVSRDHHVSRESARVDTDQQRRQRFRTTNLYGHSSDSSAQRLLYGTDYGTGKMPVPTTEASDARRADMTPTTAGNIQFVRDTEMIPYQDDFEKLFCDAPKVDMLEGHFISGFGGRLSLPSQLDDDTSAHLFVSLPKLLKRSITAPLLAQVSLVNENIVNLFNSEYRIDEHFRALRRFMLMQDGEFGEMLSSQLFSKLSLSPTVHEMFNPVFLNSALQSALRASTQGEDECTSNVSFLLRRLPSVLRHNAPDALDGLELTYRVQWPVNVVISDDCISIYSKVFSFMLLLKRAVWSLSDVWTRLKRDFVVMRVSTGSTQYRTLQLYRHEMTHFVNTMQEYIANQVIFVTWLEFQEELKEIHDLDDLRTKHVAYLLKCQARCLLNKKAHKIMQVMESIFALILKFRMQLLSAAWKQVEIMDEKGSKTGRTTLQHPHYEHLCKTFKSFTEHSRFLFRVVSKLAVRDYQPHLKELVLRLNFNGYYESGK